VDHLGTVTRYRAKVCQRGPEDCWPWLGAISSSGHGKFRAGPGAAVGVTAHVLGYQLAHGVIADRTARDLVVAHRCDEPSCQNPAHWELVSRAANGDQYQARCNRGLGPLADERGPTAARSRSGPPSWTPHRTGADVEQALAAAAAAGLRSADTPCSDREMSGSGDSFPA
jgi:hypothetical protein